MIVDGDAHVIEPQQVWNQYLGAAFRERLAVEYARGERGHVDVIGGPRKKQSEDPELEDGKSGGWDPNVRLAAHDAAGVAAAVLFPTAGMTLGGLSDVALAEAACRAINDWAV